MTIQLPPDYEFRKLLVKSRIGRPVALAHHRVLNVDHVIKLYSSADSKDSIAFGEPRLMQQIEHRNIVKVHEAGVLPGTDTLWIATDLYKAGSLDSHSRKWPQWPLLQKLEAIASVLDAIQHLQVVHQILHRDIKPSNVLLDRGAKGRYQALLTDFGSAAKMDAKGECPPSGGSLWYTAPEVYRKAPVTIRSDIYATGLVLYELLRGSFVRAVLHKEKLLAGERPFEIELPAEVPDVFADIVDKATHPDPAQRFASPARFLEALRRNMKFDIRHFALPRGDRWIIHRPHKSMTRSEAYEIRLERDAKDRDNLDFYTKLLPGGRERKIGRTIIGSGPKFLKKVLGAVHRICRSPQRIDDHIDRLRDSL